MSIRISQKKKYKPLTEAQKKKAKKYRDKGLTYEEIARLIGSKSSTVHSYINK